MLGVDVLAGNQSHANHTLPGLLRILDGLASQKRPKLVRGDAGLAGEPMLCALEERGQHYLFKLRLTRTLSATLRSFSGSRVGAKRDKDGKAKTEN